MEDHPDYDLSFEKDLVPCFDFIDKGPGATLVVCTAGMSRSATVCIAYLMKSEGLSFKEAFDKCQNARPYIRPNSGFTKFLKAYERELMPLKEMRKPLNSS